MVELFYYFHISFFFFFFFSSKSLSNYFFYISDFGIYFSWNYFFCDFRFWEIYFSSLQK